MDDLNKEKRVSTSSEARNLAKKAVQDYQNKEEKTNSDNSGCLIAVVIILIIIAILCVATGLEVALFLLPLMFIAFPKEVFGKKK